MCNLQVLAEEIGFSQIEFEFFELEENSVDNVLRIGQNNPSLYLRNETTAGIPAFEEMDSYERMVGLRELRKAINNGRINDVIADYTAKATATGYVGLIVATK